MNGQLIESNQTKKEIPLSNKSTILKNSQRYCEFVILWFILLLTSICQDNVYSRTDNTFTFLDDLQKIRNISLAYYIIGRILGIYFIINSNWKFIPFSFIVLNSITNIANIYIEKIMIFYLVRLLQEISYSMFHGFYFAWIEKFAPENSNIKLILISLILMINPLESFIIEICGALTEVSYKNIKLILT